MKKILVVIPFDNVYPPMNGGMLRCFNLLNQLCKYFDVTAIMHQEIDSFLQASIDFPAIKNCNLLSTKENRKNWSVFSLFPSKYLNAILYRFWNRSLSETASSDFLLLFPQLRSFLKSNKVDYVIFEDMSILNLSKLVKRFQPKTPVIYDAYNVNTILANSAFEKGEISSKNFDSIRKNESNIFKYADNIFTCSENDLVQICQMNQGKINGIVVPNGVGIPQKALRRNTDKEQIKHNILFCGSLDYSPNREGLIWFLKKQFSKNS